MARQRRGGGSDSTGSTDRARRSSGRTSSTGTSRRSGARSAGGRRRGGGAADGGAPGSADRASRSYESPLRQAQARRTAELVLEAFAAAVADGRLDVSVRELAEGAGVSERTVYRHFPDRHALRDGLSTWLDGRLPASEVDERTVDTLEEAADLVPGFFAGFDSQHDLIRAVNALATHAGGAPSPGQQARTGEFRRLLRASAPDLDDAAAEQVLAVLRLLMGGTGYLYLTDVMGLDSTRAGEAVRWAVRALVDAARRGDGILADDDDAPGAAAAG